MKRVIVLHPKQLEDEEVTSLADRLDKFLYAVIEEPCELVTAREVFLDFEKKYGKPVNWERWARYVAGTSAAFGTEPNFHALIVAPESIVGKATAEIVRQALRNGRWIFRLTADSTLVRVTKVTELDPESFTRGWVVS